MFLSVLFFLISLVPSVLILVWLSKRHREDALYKKVYKSALIRGLISVLPILALSGALALSNAALKATVLKGANVFLIKAIYNFVVLAFAEEFIKLMLFRAVLKKKPYPYSWADVTAVMVIIGTAFGLIEDLPYAIGANPMTMLVRGLTMGHVGYGFVMGWFYAKRLYTGKKAYGVLALVLPWLVHGLYDFSLAPELIELNDNFAFLGVSLAVFDLVLLVLMFRFFKRAKKMEIYQTTLPQFEAYKQPETAEPTSPQQDPQPEQGEPAEH